jgi:hypothetical protein
MGCFLAGEFFTRWRNGRKDVWVEYDRHRREMA